MKTQKNLSIFMFCCGGLFLIGLYIIPLAYSDNNEIGRPMLFLCMAMVHIYLLGGLILNVTSRKIEELQIKVEELTRKQNESESES